MQHVARLNFGLRCLPPLRGAADVATPFQMEQMYGVLGVGLNYPAELRARISAKHGRPPMASVAFGRRGY